MKPLTKVPDLKFAKDWRRLKFVIDQSGETEWWFAKQIDLENLDLINRIHYAQCGIDEQLARKIHARYPQYSVEWLLGQPDAEEPRLESMFPDVRVLNKIKRLAYQHAEQEFKSQAEFISSSIIKAIPLKGEEQDSLLEVLCDEAEELSFLYQILQACVAPDDISDLNRYRDLCDDLCEALDRLCVFPCTTLRPKEEPDADQKLKK